MGTQRRVLLATLLSLTLLFLWQFFTYKPQQNQQLNNAYQQEETQLKSSQQNQQVKQIERFEPYTIQTEKLKLVFNKYTAGIIEAYVKEDTQQDYTLLFKEEKSTLNLNSTEEFSINETNVEGNKKVTFYNKFYNIEYNFPQSEPYFVEVNVNSKNPRKINLEFAAYIHSDKYGIEPNNVNICKVIKTDNKEYTIVEKTNKVSFQNKTDICWISLSSKYFIVAIVFDRKTPIDLSVEKYNKNSKKLIITSSEEKINFTYKLLFAPKKISLLTSLGNKFTHTIDWGTFALLSKLFYNILYYFYKISKNYGIAIIGLTIIIQIITLPLTYNSIKSTLKIKKIQPQLQLLQKLYKDEPKRLNIEIMNLYREKKVNPFGGCLPLLLQIPIFWSLFTMLRNTYDLRGAKFILWITDLSQPDKLLIPGTNLGIPILVLLMGATMFFQQWLSGAMNDPQQRTMTIMMPVIFTILFFNFPSGLVLYWFINNIFSIIIQIIASKTVEV